MGLKKKKNVIILTLFMVACFMLYQLYFFVTISEAGGKIRVIPVFDHKTVHLRSDDDKFVNMNGVIRGVIYSQILKYRPDFMNEFKCLKSEQRIPFQYVNDDFCDCEDGSDEPSTNACADGIFHCDTQYHNKPISNNKIPSSKVNDGICDCCDGSDEWIHKENEKLVSQSNSKNYRFYVTKCPDKCDS